MSAQIALRQRGMAVIAALLVVVAAAALTTSIIERQGILANILITESDRSQAAWALQGGLDLSRVVLQMDAGNGPTTRLDGIWARSIIELPVGPAGDPESALLSGGIEDEQGKYNLRNLAEHGIINPRQVLVLERLLEWLGMAPTLGATMAQRVADAQSGQEGGPVAVGLRSIEDLSALPGFTPQVVNALQPYVTVLPAATPVNANTASAEVLGAVVEELGLAGARQLVIDRDQGLWFVNQADFVSRLRGRQPDAGKLISVSSNWFRVTGEVTVGDTMAGLRVLLHRNDHGLSSVRWVTY